MIYPKTANLWKRNSDTGIIMPGNYTRNEFGNIKCWHVTEKIDGMNIRIIYKNSQDGWKPILTFTGRTNKAILPTPLLERLQDTFTIEMFKELFPDAKYVCLFGEGYGAGINSGHNYSPIQKFVLFDVVIDSWWLKQDVVTNIANKFYISRVPIYGIWNTHQCIDFINQQIKNNNIKMSELAIEPNPIEGIYCRSHPLMLFRNKSPVTFKLKVKDYVDYYKKL